MSEIKQKLRCAIYTRKSTEEGLEKEFNTLDAQRESGEAYAQSHKHEGWIILSEHYDDGGFSGGNTERPGLKRLLEDIDKGLIDVVIVYKIDRLSRSLSDFTKLIDNFEKRGVAFVSVTQHFNTSSSMVRLTLTKNNDMLYQINKINLPCLSSYNSFINGDRINGQVISDNWEQNKEAKQWYDLLIETAKLNYDFTDIKDNIARRKSEEQQKRMLEVAKKPRIISC